MKQANSFDELAMMIMMQDRQLKTQNKLITYYRARTYSITKRNRHLVFCCRALFILDLIMILVVVGLLFLQFG